MNAVIITAAIAVVVVVVVAAFAVGHVFGAARRAADARESAQRTALDRLEFEALPIEEREIRMARKAKEVEERRVVWQRDRDKSLADLIAENGIEPIRASLLQRRVHDVSWRMNDFRSDEIEVALTTASATVDQTITNEVAK